MANMKRMGLAAAKNRFSEVIEDVERRHRKVLILRRGKPAAAIVPADQAAPPRPPPPMTDDEIAAVWASLGRGDTGSALADLLESRGRLDVKV